MKARWIFVSLAAAGLLATSSLVAAADARRGSGPSGGYARTGGGHHSVGSRYTGMRSAGPAGIRSGNSARFYGGGNAFYGGVHHSYPGYAHRHHRHRFVGLPYGIYAGYGYYGSYGYYDSIGAYTGGCDWLRRQAMQTGSVYWWDRYNACSSGYGY